MDLSSDKVVKNQHYVPQFYLKYFADKDDKLFVFDKFKKKSFNTNVRNVASENYFYDLPVELIEEEKKAEFENIDKQELEKVMCRVEGYCKKNFDQLITMFYLGNPDRLYSMEVINDELKVEMAFYMATQIARTKEFREYIVESHEKLAKAIMDRIGKVEIEDYSPESYKIKVKKEMEPVLHAQFLIDNESIEDIAMVLLKHIWVVGINNTGKDLFSSDNPIVRHGHKKSKFFGYSGIASEGIEICFPINNKLILVLYERSYFNMLTQFENKCLRLSNSNIDYYNSLQVLQSYRQVFNKNNDFSFIEFMGQRQPSIYSESKSRVST